MGNTSNPEKWGVQERLKFIERAAYWRGWVRRQDLMAIYGKGMAQVSADFQKYQELNPAALSYSMNRKRYEGQESMKQVLQSTRLEDAIGLFMADAGRPPLTGATEASSSPAVDWVVLPERRAAVEVERRVFHAVLHLRRVRVRYLSVHGSSDEWRWMCPHALAHSGHRWHVRAWCEKNHDYRDFVIGRMVEADWPVPADPPPEADSAWNTVVTLTLRPASALSPGQQASVAQEFGMTGGTLTLRVRQAMQQYLEHQLGLQQPDDWPRLERVAPPPAK